MPATVMHIGECHVQTYRDTKDAISGRKTIWTTYKCKGEGTCPTSTLGIKDRCPNVEGTSSAEEAVEADSATQSTQSLTACAKDTKTGDEELSTLSADGSNAEPCTVLS